MGLFSNKAKKPVEFPPDMNLTAEELEVILRLLSTTHFPVKDIEFLYKAIYKLQEEYNRLKNA